MYNRSEVITHDHQNDDDARSTVEVFAQEQGQHSPHENMGEAGRLPRRDMKSRGIGMSLLVYILIFSSFITLILTAFQLYLDYRREVSVIEQRLGEVREGYVHSITASLWNMDQHLLRSQLDGIVRLPDMTRATVRETFGGVVQPLVITAGSESAEVHIWREFPLIDLAGADQQVIGVLRVGATLSEVYKRLFDKAVVILLSQGIKTFIVSFFILFIVHHLITRHLTSISQFVSQMNLRAPLQPLKLNRNKPKQRDEFDHMVQAFNGMQTNLEVAYDQLRQANATLELRVSERTRSLEAQIVERRAIEASLRESEERFRDIAEAASDWFWEMDENLRFSFVSARFFELTRLSHEDVIGKSLGDLVVNEVLTMNGSKGKVTQEKINRRAPFNEVEGKVRGSNGGVYNIQIDGKPLFDDDDNFIGYRGAGRDITLRKAAEEAIQRSHKELENLVAERTAEVHKLSQAVEQSPVLVVISDLNGYVEYVNRAFTKIMGYYPDEIIGQETSIFKSGLTHDSVYREMWQKLKAGLEWSGELLDRKKDGSTIWMQVHIGPVKNSEGEITHYLGIEEDISLRKEQEERILHQAQYDSLTDLPNRLLAIDRLDHATKLAKREDTKVALMYIDLDDFKKVNDNLGHDVGDALLVEAAKRLASAVRGGDTVARQGGDEFLVILSGLQASIDAEPVIQKILHAFVAPFVIDGADFVVTPSIGLSIFPDDGDNAATLLRNADAAMYRTKDQGGNGFSYFTSSMNEEGLKRLQIERHLLNALDRDELHIAYQPIVDAKSREIVGVEALLRWHNAELGFVGPDQFIPVAEHTGIIVHIGRWVMETACAQVATWNSQLGLSLSLAVNVSPRQFRNQRILETIELGLAQGLAPELLEIEVTEGLFISKKSEAAALLDQLKERGVNLSMDDFGTGYSSLSYLKTLPFDTMKVDRSFVNDLANDPDDLALVTAAISMAKSLGLKVIGEGVETDEQLAILVEQGCHEVQGYLFSKPVPADEFINLISAPDALVRRA
ncbi:MAG: EAL domain-containing protein [Magnetovibrio sp.]|nr:EAL domain-containing protein [Magnetovibrio sp.]